MDALIPAAPAATWSRARSAASWLKARPRLIFGGLAVILLMAAGTLGRPWLEALGIGSAFVSLLPCAAMCAAGLCMKGGGGQCANKKETVGQAGVETRPASRITTAT